MVPSVGALVEEVQDSVRDEEKMHGRPASRPAEKGTDTPLADRQSEVRERVDE